MRTYLLVTAVAFALLALMHVWRVIAESTSLMRDPWFVVITVISAALSVWAFRLWRQSPRST
jgi:dolichyl-phosphate-mannose--protein O-mannosyl transferase